MTKNLEVGRLLRAGMSGFVAGCRVSQLESPKFGSLVRVSLDQFLQIYGLIYDINVSDDGLIKQLVTVEGIERNVIEDNRQNRNVPIELSVLTVGYKEHSNISHLLPPRPALSLDAIYLCDDHEIRQFTGYGKFGYFRHVFRGNDFSAADVIAAHMQAARKAHLESGNETWFRDATNELIVLLRDDYEALIDVLGALSELQMI